MISSSTGYGASVGSRADFYSWDGTFLRSLDVAGVVDRGSVDGAYVVNDTSGDIWSSTGARVGSIDVFGPGYNGGQGRLAFNWANDGDYFCSLDRTGTGFALLLEDVRGEVQRIPLNVPTDLVANDGIPSMQVRCSLSSNRAIVWEDDQPQKVALFSLPVGNVISEFTLGTYIAWSWSSDLQWLLAYNAGAAGPHDEVVDTATGSITAQFDGDFSSFTPDGHNLVGTDASGDAAMLNWRSKTEVWSGAGHLETVMAYSDPSTNKMLLWLSTGSDQAGTTTYDYWIVDGDGTAFRFSPKNCGPNAASRARC